MVKNCITGFLQEKRKKGAISKIVMGITVLIIVSAGLLGVAIIVMHPDVLPKDMVTTSELTLIASEPFELQVFYDGGWNAFCIGWQGSNTVIANSTFTGYGSANRTITLTGNVYAGMRLDVTIQKEDNSSATLQADIIAPHNTRTVENSTNLPYGQIFLGIGVLS